MRMSLGAGRAHQALEFANLYPRGPFPSGRLGGGRGCGCSCPPSTLPGPCGQSGFLEVQAAAARAARPPSGPRPRGPLTQGPRSTGREAGPGHAGALPPDAPHTRPGPPSPHRAGARPGSGGAGTAHRARPGHPQVAGDWAALMTGCPHVCVCMSVLPLPQAHPGPPGPPREPTSTSASLSPASLPRPLGSEAPWRAWSGVLWTGPSHQAPLPLGPLGNDHTGHLDGPDEVTDDVRGGPWPPRVGQVQGSGW